MGAGLVAAGLCAFGVRGMQAQGFQPAPPAAPPVHQTDDPLLKNFTWRSIGPANMGGRIDDIAVVESKPSTFYVGFATGGLWKTTNNGTTFTPVFDDQPVTSIGDIAVAPSNPDVVYVGTGEPNNRQSSSFGAGVYKSTDAGKTWKYTGLKETQSIARVVVHPKDPNTVYVAVIGHLFGPNKERGLYKSTDGGANWTNTKFIDEDTGFTDLVMDPVNPNVLYAASYQRRRQPWGFNGGGPGSGIWKTTDAGKNWTKMTGNGLPTNPIIGRIGLDVARSKPSTIYASIEVGPSGGTGANVNDDGSLVDPNAQGGRGGGGGGGGRGQAPPPPDPNKSGIWRSDDAGKTWRFLSNSMDRPMYYSQIRIDPTNPEIAYQGGAPFFKTTDGGKTWRQVQGLAHSDHHAIWIDPRDGNHLLVGNDGGLDISYDQGDTWDFVNSIGAVGQFYKVSADMREPYYVCGGLQDNGSWCGPSGVRSGNGILNSDWYRVGGGDGFYTANDWSDWRILYSESQDGNTSRLDLGRGTTVLIRPRGPSSGRGGGNFGGGGEGGADPALLAQFGFGAGAANGNIVPPPPQGTNFRFYWNTPFQLSPHNPSTIYLGGERLFKSMDRGNTWVMSEDLTRNVGRNDRAIMGVDGKAAMASKHDGAAAYSNIVTLSESPVVPGIVWVGTNDGNVQVSRDGGLTWKNVIDKIQGVPKETHVSRVEASPFDAGGAYVTFDGHRTDDHKPYVFVTKDFGDSWTSIASNLPLGNVNVITADNRNRNLLFLGTEYGIYVSTNAGREWKPLMQGMPTVRIDDLVIHPRERDLIVGTHGRSIWILDDISPLELMNETTMEGDAYLFDVRPATSWLNDIQRQITVGGQKNFRASNPDPGTTINYWLKGNANNVRISITDITGREVRAIDGPKTAGLNRVRWDLRGGTPQRGAAGGGGGAEQPIATAPTMQPPAQNPPANPPAAGQQGTGREDRPATTTATAPQQGRGGQAAGQQQAGQQAAAPQAGAQQGQGGGGGGGGGRGRGGFGGPALAPGSYLVKVTVDNKVIGTKTITVKEDRLQ